MQRRVLRMLVPEATVQDQQSIKIAVKKRFFRKPRGHLQNSRLLPRWPTTS
jgi:hypothetical protein